MSTPNDPKDPWNDDIEALFKAEHSAPPPAIDQAILSAAYEAIANQKHEHDQAISHPVKRWYSYWPQGLSAAAVVVVAVLLVPTIVSTPESSLGSSLLSDKRLVPKEEAFSAEASAQVSQAEDTISELSVAPQLANEARTSVSSIAESPTVSSSRASASAKRSTLAKQTLDPQQALIARLDGTTYQSEVEPIWKLMFNGDGIIWDHENRKKTGTYQFLDNNTFIAQFPNRKITVEFSGNGLVWDDEYYKRLP